VQKRVQDLKALQELLESRGIAFSLLISTNVPALYPELIPAAYTDPTRNSRQNSYDIARPLLDRYEVNYIDGHELLQGMKGEYPFRLFQNTASHWNRVASCRVTDALAAQLSELTGKSVSRIPCLPITVDPKPRDFDQDLLEIANLLFPESTHRPAPYPPDSAADDMPKGEKLKILMVGTSFSYSILGNLRRYQISDAYKLYFYYRQLHIGPGKNVGINHRRINWDRDVFSHDAIIIETNVSGIGNAGFKFVSDALSKLRQGQ
jgi:hypothetical protein